MGGRWNPIRSQFLCFLVLILTLQIHGSLALNDEGLNLLEFRARVDFDPFGALDNWDSDDSDPCSWLGIYCVNGEVEAMNLTGFSLEGTLGPELGKLVHLKSLVLSKNHFYGPIPKELGALTHLELLDLTYNDLSGNIPSELEGLQSLKTLLISDNKIEGNVPQVIGRLNLLSEFQYDASASSQGVDTKIRKFGHRFKLGNDGLPVNGGFTDNYSDKLVGSLNEHAFKNVEILVNLACRKLLDLSSNLQAAPAANGSSSVSDLPISLSSGSFLAIPADSANQSSPTSSPASSPNSTDAPSQSVPPVRQKRSSGGEFSWIYYLIIAIAVILIIVLTVLIFVCRKKGVPKIGPWKTGLSGQLQKAFVTGVPKLNRQELETACEDFSNIVEAFDNSMVYKGTLSSGVEIAVVSTTVCSSKDWSKAAEMNYRKQIDSLSRINHKNFINLLGYCREEEPFTRMMVFEYAPNGTLFEHLHVKEMENLDWIARMRIIMGIAYCLQYIHHELNPPVAHYNLTSNCIYFTDDYAAKIGQVTFPADPSSKPQVPGEEATEPTADAETNVYSFGILLLEMISGKLPYSAELGPIEKWAEQYFRDKRSISYMIDPNIKTLKDNELDVICEVIQQCIRPDQSQRPTMKEVTAMLKEVIGITPDQAIPRLSPLWWAELEILSVEAT